MSCLCVKQGERGVKTKELLLLIKQKQRLLLKESKKKNKNCVSIDKKNFYNLFSEAVGGGEEGEKIIHC